MSEPVQSAVAAAGASVFMAMLGVEHQVLLASAAGAMLGTGWAPPGGRAQQISAFVAAVLLCAYLGGSISEAYFSGSMRASQGWAGLLGAVLHPLLAATVDLIKSRGLLGSLSAVMQAWRGKSSS